MWRESGCLDSTNKTDWVPLREQDERVAYLYYQVSLRSDKMFALADRSIDSCHLG